MFKNIKIRSKILIVIASVATTAVAVSAYLSDVTSRQTLEREAFNKLTAVREMKANQIEGYFQQISDQVRTFSEDRMIIDAMSLFKSGFRNINRELNITNIEMKRIDANLERYYQNEFLKRLNPNLEQPALVSDYLPTETNTRIVQDLYIASNPHETGSKFRLEYSRNGSSYSKTHQLYHPVIRSYLERFGYYDIFLIDHATGHIVYTVFKEVDYGTSLLTGPYQNTNFAEAFRAAKNVTYKDFIYLVDFKPYHPSYNARASFIASPIFDGEKKIGVLVFQMPVDRINDIMTSQQAWSEVGLGKSGETYIVGNDYKLRNQSRFLIEDSTNYFRVMEESGVSAKTIEKIRNFQSTIGLQKVKTAGIEAALRGEAGTGRFPDYRGVMVFSSYMPLNIPGVHWVIMSEIDLAEAFAPLYSIRKGILLGFLVLIVLIVVVAVLFSRTITNPLRGLTADAEELAKGNLDVSIDSSGEDEIGALAKSFQTMQTSIRDLVRRQEEAIDALSTPLIPLHDEVVVLPLVGELDDRRVKQIRTVLTEGLHQSGAKVAILDFTGVPVFNAGIALGLLRAAQSASLLGARVVLTGMQPAIARELADLDLNFNVLVTERTLQKGIDYAMSYIKKQH
jgi:methyl-accepting chemotaxis protein